MSDRIAELMNQLNEFLDIVCDDVSSEKYDWASRRGSELIERLEKEIIKEMTKNILLYELEDTDLPQIPEDVIDLILKYL
jgi:hypothetical protein|tara:strand:- start:343 stop:582 length:240 start_codon:yes stop_codon:yes gene_type:complete